MGYYDSAEERRFDELWPEAERRLARELGRDPDVLEVDQYLQDNWDEIERDCRP